MNAWTNDLGDVRVRSIALPTDRGVMGGDATRGRYSVYATTDVKRTFRRERRRLEQEAAASAPTQQAAPAGVHVFPLHNATSRSAP